MNDRSAGHPRGGLIARGYANQYPHEVAGILLVDATHAVSIAALKKVYGMDYDLSPDPHLDEAGDV